MTDSDKLSSLMQHGINYDRKIFYSSDPGSAKSDNENIFCLKFEFTLAKVTEKVRTIAPVGESLNHIVIKSRSHLVAWFLGFLFA